MNKALELTRVLKEPFREMEIYEHLYDCYYAAGDYKDAIAATNRSNKMSDSLNVVNNEKQISEYQIKYETAKKDMQLALRDRQIIAVLAGSLIFIIFSVILYLRYRKQSEKTHIIKQSIERKDMALQSIAYIQAHELRKPLASIMGLVNVIRSSGHQVDDEDIAKLEHASKELDARIRAIISRVEDDK